MTPSKARMKRQNPSTNNSSHEQRQLQQNNDFDRIVSIVMSRRDLMKNAICFGGVATLGSLTSNAETAELKFNFDTIPADTIDEISLPDGYSYKLLIRWGDPLWSDGREFDPSSCGDAASQKLAFGDNNDGMHIFSIGGRTLLAVNNEFSNRPIIWGNRLFGRPGNHDDLIKAMMAHGISVVEIAEQEGNWSIVKDSEFNRRITPDSSIKLTGHAAGHPLLQTANDLTGRVTLGTWNNCGSGSTPWGTYLTCEENFNGYFSASDPATVISPALKRYGIKVKEKGYGWAKIDERFDISRHPNEPNRVGYVVEIDPANPDSTPRKLTSLGRFKHENAELVVNHDGRIVVYMGDDEAGEFLYRYISDAVFKLGMDTDELLEQGQLYAARFETDGSGEWLLLNPQTTGMASMAEICVHTRLAASAVGATTMDRPEWVAAHPHKAEIYCALTNNKHRAIKPNAGGDQTPAAGPNPRVRNLYGQIVRWRPADQDHTAARFSWDLYVLAGNPAVHTDQRAGSGNITIDNMFNAPDGIKFDSNGLLWIQTDGQYTNTGDFAGHGNNQMLAGNPVSGEIRRFMVGPKQCEITGLTWSPDRRTMFVGIQHPGHKGQGNWPDGGESVPRSAVIAIRRDDGGLIG